MTSPLPPAIPKSLEPTLADQARSFREHTLQRLAPEPFFGTDTTVGVENEFQVAVEGKKDAVDLALTILESNYYKNLTRRAGRGDLSPHVLTELDAFLGEQQEQLWENSWVRFPRRLLGGYAASILNHDLLADKSCPHGPMRQDAGSFLFAKEGETWLRVPISYLLKLSLAEAIGQSTDADPILKQTGERLMDHLISDNSSPEVISFILSKGGADELPGRNTARETSRRFFLLQLLIQFANREFRLEKYGQTCRMYLAPNPPARQKRLNDLISDQFYRELFLNPCLSGWQQGEKKKEYMGLCHRTLSRSQLNTIAKLKEAGIIVNNLVILPNTSSTSLANNGTHITLGSGVLGHCYQEPRARRFEKYFGDLVIKIVEHFLPLFVTTCSGAPHRLGFADFHPEKVLGYLPHELDYTHLRMIWRRWKKKAHIRFCGHSFTPMGPLWLDRMTSRLLHLRGDYLPDVRLLDYLVALHSVEQSPALNGREHNQERLKQDLTEMGVFDSRMNIYLPYRMRAFADHGFSGFEGRHYSLFPDLRESMARAVNLQAIVTALAYEWAISGELTHDHIPDDPCTESERRQIFFAAAIGLPTVFIRADTKNRMLRQILGLVERQRPSHRYKGYLRIEVSAYQLACLELLRRRCGWSNEVPGVGEEFTLLEGMLKGSVPTAASRLTSAILNRHGRADNPMQMEAQTFNQAAETYYRRDLCALHLANGLETLKDDGQHLDDCRDPAIGLLKEQLTGKGPATLFIREAGSRVLAGEASSREIQVLILLIILIIHRELHIGGEEQ